MKKKILISQKYHDPLKVDTLVRQERILDIHEEQELRYLFLFRLLHPPPPPEVGYPFFTYVQNNIRQNF